MMFAQCRPPPSDTTGSTADEEDEREGADHQDTHSLGQFVLLGVILDHLLDRLNGLAGWILEEVPHGAHGPVGLDRGDLQQVSQQREDINSLDPRLGVFRALRERVEQLLTGKVRTITNKMRLTIS